MSEPSSAILSPDGQHRWDGQAWQPVVSALAPSPAVHSATLIPAHAKQSAGFQFRRNPVIALVAIAVLGVGAWVVFGRGTGLAGKQAAKPTHTLSGTLTLVDSANLTCTYGDGQVAIDNLDALMGGKTFPCPDGPGGGYSDIGQGTSVSVFDPTGTLVATGNLQGGTAALGGINFPFTIPTVPEESLYQVEVANRGKISYSSSDLEANGWIVGVKLGGS